MHERRYSGILSEIVEDYQLYKKPIIQFDDNPDPMEAWAEYFNSKILRIVIGVNTDMFHNVEDDVIFGGLAHELVHLEDFSKMNAMQYSAHMFQYNNFNNFRRKTERDADLRTILKGKKHGMNLLKCREYRCKTMPRQRFEIMKDFYLSPDEIKQEIQKRWQ